MTPSLNQLKAAYDASKNYADFVQTGQWMRNQRHVSDFWAHFLSKRRNYPTFNEVLCLRRGFTYPLADRGGKNIDLKQEFLHAEKSYFDVSQTIPEYYFNEVQESSFGAPLSFEFKKHNWSAGGLINALTACRIFEACKNVGLDTKPIRILEFGAGYGQVASQLMQKLNIKTYAICDLPENLFLSSYYLQGLHGESNVTFVKEKFDSQNSKLIFTIPPFLELLTEKFDLIINSYSFQEMNLESVVNYFAFSQKYLNDGGIFYSLNSHGKAGVSIPEDYPVENFSLRRCQTIRRHPTQIFATIPYEWVMTPKAPGAQGPDKDLISSLGFLTQLGFYDELNRLGNDLTSERLSKFQIDWLKTTNIFFKSKSRSEKFEAFSKLQKIGIEPELTAYLGGTYFFVLGDWQTSQNYLRRSGLQNQRSHASLLYFLMLYVSALKTKRRRDANQAIVDAFKINPYFKTEIDYWKRRPDDIVKEMSILIRLIRRKKLSLSRIVLKAQEKLRLTPTWHQSVGY